MGATSSPSCIGQPEVHAVGVGTGQPAKLYVFAQPQVHDEGRELDIGEQLRAACRRVPSKEKSVDVLPVLAGFHSHPGLLHPLGLVFETEVEKVIEGGGQPKLGRSDTPETASDVEDTSSHVSEINDEWEDVAEDGHEARQLPLRPPGLFLIANEIAEYGHEARQLPLRPPGLFCSASQVPTRSPPGIFF